MGWKLNQNGEEEKIKMDKMSIVSGVHLAAKMISSLLARAIISQEAATKGEQQKKAPRGPGF